MKENKKIWKISLKTGIFVFIAFFVLMTAYYFTFFPSILGNLGLKRGTKLLLNYKISLTIINLISSFLQAGIISLPLFFVRRITLSSKPKLVFLLSLPYLLLGVGSILFIYPIKFGKENIGPTEVSSLWGFYLIFFIALGLIIYYYFKDKK